jgi:hypothetical protein
MKGTLLSALFLSLSLVVSAQGFEVAVNTEIQQGAIGETIKTPISVKNTSDKPLSLILRKVDNQLGSTQKIYYCLDKDCTESRSEDYQFKLEPGQSLSALQIGLETGLVASEVSARYIIFNKYNPTQASDFTLHYTIHERSEKQNIFNSPNIVIHDAFPNPVTENIFTIHYKILNPTPKYKLFVYNLLGNVVGEYKIDPYDTSLRIRTDDFNSGIYFYTLSLNGEGVMTRKVVIRK